MASGHGKDVCARCSRRLAISVTQTCEEFLQLCEDLTRVGEQYSSNEAESIVRIVDAEIGPLVDAVQQALQRAQQRVKIPFDGHTTGSAPTPEDVIAGGALDRLERAPYVQWLDLELCAHLASHLDSDDDTLYALFKRVFGRRGCADRYNRFLRAALLGELVLPSSLGRTPARKRLSKLSAAAYVTALFRVVAVGEILRHGHAPSERFIPAERHLYLRLVPEQIRRAQRTFWDVLHVIEEAASRNARAEELQSIWLLNPVGGPLRDYLPLMFDAAASGRTPDAIICCRAVVERAIAATAEKLDVDPDGRFSMNQRIDQLRRVGALSSTAAGKARAVWQRGNLVVHNNPRAISDCMETVRYAVEVLHELSPGLQQ